MAQLKKLPEAHTDFVFSLRWDDSVLPLVLLAIVALAGIIAFLLYRRRRRN